MLRTTLAAMCVMAVATGAHATRLPKMTNSVGMTLVKVPAGSFMMGDESCEEVPKLCPDPFDRNKQVPCKDGSKTLKCNGEYDEKPLRHVTLTNPFWVMTTEVTQRQYYDVIGKNPSGFTSDKLGYRSENNPVEQVNWYEALSFANKLSDKEGLTRCYSGAGDNVQWDRSCTGYRLPTEAEWEYAARAGQSTKYAGSNSVGTVAWYDDNSGDKTHPVGQKKPNAWGLYDMSGNVWEWVWGWKGSYSGEEADLTGPSYSSYLVYRGGSWRENAWSVRVARRKDTTPGYGYDNKGFRLVRAP